MMEYLIFDILEVIYYINIEENYFIILWKNFSILILLMMLWMRKKDNLLFFKVLLNKIL